MIRRLAALENGRDCSARDERCASAECRRLSPAAGAKSLVIDPAAAPRTPTRIGLVVEQVPALVLGIAEQGEGEEAGGEIEVLEHQSSSSVSSLLTGAWSLSAQRPASKAAWRRRVKIGKMTRKSSTSTKLLQPAPPLKTSTVSRTATGFSGARSGSTLR